MPKTAKGRDSDCRCVARSLWSCCLIFSGFSLSLWNFFFVSRRLRSMTGVVVSFPYAPCDFCCLSFFKLRLWQCPLFYDVRVPCLKRVCPRPLLPLPVCANMFEISLFSLFILRFLCRRRQFCRLLPLKSFFVS